MNILYIIGLLLVESLHQWYDDEDLLNPSSSYLYPSSEPQLWPVGMVLEGSSEALCPPPSLELRPSCNKSQPSPPLGSSSQPHDGVFPEDKEPVKYGELIVLG